jgi:peptidyl-prolyl cis-trans isomerase A (cyclophilin A)
MRLAWIALAMVACLSPAVAAEPIEDDFTPPDGLSEGWYARIETSAGRIIARLLPEQAPQSVAHFAALAEGRLEWFDRNDGKVKKGPYYDGIRVHQAMAGRLFEAGDPTGTGLGAPDLFVAPEGAGPINFNAPYRLGMAQDGGVLSAVKFFVTAAAVPRRSGFNPCFGLVVEGQSVVLQISQVKTHGDKRPLDPPIIERIRVFAVGEVPPLPEPVPYRHVRRHFEADPKGKRSEEP